MENLFILLHKSDDNTPVVVNISQIEQIYKSTKNDSTIIVFVNNDDDMPVNESVERIYNIIETKLNMCSTKKSSEKTLLTETKK